MGGLGAKGVRRQPSLTTTLPSTGPSERQRGKQTTDRKLTQHLLTYLTDCKLTQRRLVVRGAYFRVLSQVSGATVGVKKRRFERPCLLWRRFPSASGRRAPPARDRSATERRWPRR
jgi:hypothetical protein